MNARLTAEQSDAIARSGDAVASFVDPATNREYAVFPVLDNMTITDFIKIKRLVERMGGVEKTQAALEAVRERYQKRAEADVESIQHGIADMEAGRVMPASEAIAQMRSELDAHFPE